MSRATGLKNLLNRRFNYRCPSQAFRMREVYRPISFKVLPFRNPDHKVHRDKIPIWGLMRTFAWFVWTDIDRKIRELREWEERREREWRAKYFGVYTTTVRYINVTDSGLTATISYY